MALFHKKESMSGEDGKDGLMTICETIENANLQIQMVKREYEEVNRYLQDAQIIAGLPEEEKKELSDAAEHLINLKEDISSFSENKAEITEFQLGILERYEDILPKEIERLKKEEEYRELVKGDLRKLAGEKGVLLHEEEEEFGKRKFLKKLGLFSGVLLGSLILFYLFLGRMTGKLAENPFLLTIGGGLFIAAYIFFETDKNKKAIRKNAAKQARLSQVTNKVKVKYVNQTASLDYSHDKYAVNSGKELEERYNKYVIFKAEEAKKKKTSDAYDRYDMLFTHLLEEHGLHDTEVWLHQLHAVIDNKEMVEIRHRLNERRQKIRESLQYNTKIIDEETKKLKEYMEKNPSERREIFEMAERHRIELFKE